MQPSFLCCPSCPFRIPSLPLPPFFLPSCSPVNTYSAGGGTAASPFAVMACIKCQPGTNTRGLTGQSKCQVIRPQVKRLF